MKKVVYILIFITLAFIMYLGSEILSLNQIKDSKNNLDVVNESSCNLQINQCNLIFSDSIGEISINPKPFYLNEKIEVIITFTTDLKRDLAIDLKGLDMDMGYNNYKFKTLDNITYKATFFLPTCTKDYMPWQMAIIKSDSNVAKVNLFKFLAERR